jgi:hypothetical protein
MRLKIRCDEKSENFSKIFWHLNGAWWRNGGRIMAAWAVGPGRRWRCSDPLLLQFACSKRACVRDPSRGGGELHLRLATHTIFIFKETDPNDESKCTLTHSYE